MKQVKIIHSAEEHEQALKRLSKLMDIDPPEGSAEGDEMELLSLVIESYEKKHFPRTPPDPIEVIKFMMDQQGLKKKDLIPYIGSASKVTEVLNGTRALSLSMIRKLSEGMEIPIDILIQPVTRKRA